MSKIIGITVGTPMNPQKIGGAVDSVNGQTGKVELSAADVGALSEDRLNNAIDMALAQAKDSGDFDGKDGENYVLTEDDKQDIASEVPSVYVGFENIPDSAVLLIDPNGEPSIIPELPSDVVATVGQTIVVKSVDANGKPTEWEVKKCATETYVDDAIANLPAGGGGGEWKLLYETTIEEEIRKASFTFDDKYAEYDCTLFITPNTNEGQTSRTYLWCDICNKNGDYLAQFYHGNAFPANNDTSGYAKWEIKHLEETGIIARLICHGYSNNSNIVSTQFASLTFGEIKEISFHQHSGNIPVGTKIIIYGRY